MKYISISLLIVIFIVPCAWGARAKIQDVSRDPYASALVVEADTGKVLFDENGRRSVYPASVLKIMVLLVILEKIEQGTMRLDEMVQVTKEAAQMGGSQVYLDPKEQFSVEDLLYALMVQSANDAAVALATHVAGSKAEFVALMNKRAKELGMNDTSFHSVHGLPPSAGQKVDKTTAYDLSILARQLSKNPETFKYTGTRERDFRDGKFIMRTHNHLLTKVGGCDGFKTGFFNAAGFSIVATAKREGVRIIAIVMGSKDRKVRDAKTAELLAKGFALVPAKPELSKVEVKPEPKVVNKELEPVPAPEPQKVEVPLRAPAPPKSSQTSSWTMFFLGLITGIVISALFAIYLKRRKSRKFPRYRSP